jgi:predicted  nucleic acid-binding Zn-ribbon protein
MSQVQERHEDFMNRMMREEDAKRGVSTEYNNMRLTKEIEELKDRIKQLETDMAYNTYATSPEEQRIYDLRRQP